MPSKMWPGADPARATAAASAARQPATATPAVKPRRAPRVTMSATSTARMVTVRMISGPNSRKLSWLVRLTAD